MKTQTSRNKAFTGEENQKLIFYIQYLLKICVFLKYFLKIILKYIFF